MWTWAQICCSIVPSVISFGSFPGHGTGKNFRPFSPQRIPITALLCSMKMFKDQRDTKNPRNQKPALKKNYELLKQVHLLAPKRKFISLGKATQVSKDMKIIYDFLPLSKKWFMVSSSSHLQLIVGMGRQLIFTGINGIRRGIVLDPSLGNSMGFTVT